nr:glycoside hydrolase domain-containing protein [Bacillus piscicola]
MAAALLVVSGIVFLLPQYSFSEINEQNDEEVQVSNNVENNVKGNRTNVNNTIRNEIDRNGETTIDNNTVNNVEVTVDVSVSNTIDNNVKEKGESSEGSNDNGKGNSSGDNGNGENNKYLWGVDTASIADKSLVECVEKNYGNPKVWGRYLGTKDGVSRGITMPEIERLREDGDHVLLIWNHFENATGFEKGQQVAQEAIKMADEFGVPQGTAIFADVEPTYPVDAAFLQGWYAGFQESRYKAGVYGVFDPNSEVRAAFNEAAGESNEFQDNTYVWSAAPQVGVTTKKNAPSYQPEAPKDSLSWGWQYGIEAETCNIDTNLFKSDLIEVSW